MGPLFINTKLSGISYATASHNNHKTRFYSVQISKYANLKNKKKKENKTKEKIHRCLKMVARTT
jgi:hypothetical protein